MEVSKSDFELFFKNVQDQLDYIMKNIDNIADKDNKCSYYKYILAGISYLRFADIEIKSYPDIQYELKDDINKLLPKDPEKILNEIKNSYPFDLDKVKINLNYFLTAPYQLDTHRMIFYGIALIVYGYINLKNKLIF